MGYLGNVLSLLPPFGRGGSDHLARRQPVAARVAATRHSGHAWLGHRRSARRHLDAPAGAAAWRLWAGVADLDDTAQRRRERGDPTFEPMGQPRDSQWSGLLTVFHEDAERQRSDARQLCLSAHMGGRKRGAWLVKQFVERIRPRPAVRRRSTWFVRGADVLTASSSTTVFDVVPWPRSTDGRGSTRRHRRTRASVCRTSKPWHAARRSSRRPILEASRSWRAAATGGW